MFARLGSFAVRFRWFIVAGWFLLAVVLTLLAPNINDVAVGDQRAFLPASSPSLGANEVVKKYFPDRVAPSSAVIVVDAGPGSHLDTGTGTEVGAAAGEAAAPEAQAGATGEQAAQFVASLTDWLTGPDKPAGVGQVSSPLAGDEQTKASLTSPDGQVALLLTRFTADGTEESTKQAVAAIHERLQQAPPGVKVYLTGDGPILAAYNTDSQNSLASTTWITIVLVVAILLIIYRSPVSPIIPLLTIGLAYVISRGVVALLGSGPLTISMYTNVFLIVVLFGAGTDYCLFLISRFREEMADVKGLPRNHASHGERSAHAPVKDAGSTRSSATGGTEDEGWRRAVRSAGRRLGPRQPMETTVPAVKTTVRTIGETIASSAGTVIVGLAMMAFAELGLYNTTGPSIAIGVAIALLAGLTFTPALLTILGHYAFWPRRPEHIGERGLWRRWAGKIISRPIIALVVPLIVLVPLAIYGLGLARDFDLLGDLPKTDETRQGFEVLAAHLGAGQMQPLNVLAMDDARFDTPQGLANIGKLQALLAAVPHVTSVRSFTGSLPDPKTLSVADQVATQAEAVRKGITQLQTELAAGGGSNLDLQSAAAGLAAVYGYLVQLAQGYPEVVNDPGYQKATAALTELAKVPQAWEAAMDAATKEAVARKALDQLQLLANGLASLQQSFAARPEAILLPDLYLQTNAGLKALRDAYISGDGTAARLQVVLNTGPYTTEAIDATKAVRSALASAGFRAVVEGDSAVLLDLEGASGRDMTRTMIYVLGGVFVVLVLLLRALVSPVYLILTILLSYSATMGVVRLVFVDLLGNAGIVWWVPMFMFVMLVALGMDYNIFLIGRVKEEVAGSGTRAGTRQALARTGGIITSAGIIMAGTFASLMSGSLLGLLQIGFAVAFGVLLDTFVVRTTLVPSITVLLGRWVWWPRRGPGGKKPPEAPAAG